MGKDLGRTRPRSLLRLAAAFVAGGVFFTAGRGERPTSVGARPAASADRGPEKSADAGRAAGPAHAILPRRVYSVIGLESSGTQFVSRVLERALDLPGPYREGSAPCRRTACAKGAADGNPANCRWMNLVGQDHECAERADVQVQHFSLPWGGTCHDHPDPPVVDVVLPPQCTRDHGDNATEVAACDAMATDAWGFELGGRAMVYPMRYMVDIVKMKEWYDRRGVEQYFVIVVRDAGISFAARARHCRNPMLRRQEEEVGTRLILDAINTYVLGDKQWVNNATLHRWVAERYQNASNASHGRRLAVLPSGGGVVVVSYESFVKLGVAYAQMLYAALGIESDYVPDVRDSNAKYLNGTMH